MNFNETLFRSSAIGDLMSDPKTKADKDAGLLSKTAQSYLIEVYISQKYGRDKDVQTKQMKKGIEVEQDSIDMLSKYLNKTLYKNEKRFTNDWIGGTPDIVLEDSIIDVKSSYDLWTLLGKIPNKLDSLYHWQMQSYMWLTGTKQAKVCYCLIDTPDSIIETEKYYLLKKMDVISEDSPDFVRECLKLEHSMKFGDIPMNERILVFNVDRNEDDILKIQHKVEKAREFLFELEKTHLNFNN